MLGHKTIAATVLPAGLAEEEYLLMELRENSARNDLTGTQRQQYSAEIGRLITKLAQDNDATNRNEEWFKELVVNTGVAYTTLMDWWRAFCKNYAYTATPTKASAQQQQQFFDFLEGRHQAAQAEKARKEAEAEERRMHAGLDHGVGHLVEKTDPGQ